MNLPHLLKIDPWLEPFSQTITNRINKVNNLKAHLSEKYGSLIDTANWHTQLGLHKHKKGWIFREYAPNATNIYLIGTFNNWQQLPEYKLTHKGNGIWELFLKKEQLNHCDLYKMWVQWNGGEAERLPAFAKRVVQDDNSYIFSAQVWQPEKKFAFKSPQPSLNNKPPFIYECHIGMGTEMERVGSFNEFRENVLPRIAHLGYNVIQFMAIQEHPYYGSFGYHVSNFFAVSSRFGTPEELKQLIDAAHKVGILVIMDIVHSHAVKNENEGIAKLDGSGKLYFHEDASRREHPAWDSLCFDYSKEETLRFLLSNCRYWIEEMGFDGFRFDGVTSMLYFNHGLEKAFTSYDDYYDGGQDEDAMAYLALANELIHELKPEAITIAEEMSGLPGLAYNTKEGGLGFDYRLAMGIPDYWIKLIKEYADEAWNVGAIFHEITNHRAEERTINYAESHDQALVGDKTIIFRLIDKEMYWHMSANDQNMIVDRGMALHKIIRLITASTINGGYLNFMGNEFGHPEWIDFPREGNNWSYQHARRQWSLVDNPKLKYKYLNGFDRDMVQLLSQEDDLEKAYTGIVAMNEGDQVLVFQRKDLLFVFNFNPTRSYTDYGILVDTGKYKIVLNTDSIKYGGYDRLDEKMLYLTSDKDSKNSSGVEKKQWLQLYIPSRTGFVLKKQNSKRVY